MADAAPGSIETGPRGPSTKVIKKIAGVIAAIPIVSIVVRAFVGRLGANPVESMENLTGWWALVLLLVTLACTPVKRLSGWAWPGRVRKLLGLAAFFYALAHFTTYLVFDHSFDLRAIWEDIVLRKFIFVGAFALLLLTPLAITSTGGMIRRLGPVRWNRLHRLVYVAAVAVVVHFIWRVKADLREPLIFATALAVLLGTRVIFWAKDRRAVAREG